MFLSKKDYAYETIKSEIISGAIAPGEHLVISKLAERLEISEIPVREALSILVSEKLVETTPGNRSIVTDISYDLLKETFELRIILEPICSKMATSFISEEGINELTILVDEMNDAIKDKDYPKVSKLNRQFHRKIYSFCPNKTMVSIIEDLLKTSIRASNVFRFLPERSDSSNEEHQAMLEAIKKGQSDVVYDLVKKQKEETLNIYLEKVDNEFR